MPGSSNSYQQKIQKQRYCDEQQNLAADEQPERALLANAGIRERRLELLARGAGHEAPFGDHGAQAAHAADQGPRDLRRRLRARARLPVRAIPRLDIRQPGREPPLRLGLPQQQEGARDQSQPETEAAPEQRRRNGDWLHQERLRLMMVRMVNMPMQRNITPVASSLRPAGSVNSTAT